jgi:hypothetical protein
MKNVFTHRSLLFIFALFLIASCSKKTDEVTPNSAIIGKWKNNGIVGKITGTNAGKPIGYDLSENADATTLEFKTDGSIALTSPLGSGSLKYVLSNSILTMTLSGGQTLEYTLVKVDTKELVLSFTKEQYYKYVDGFYDPADIDTKAIQSIKSNAVVEYTESYVKQ